jgi:hypothetical protein
MIMTDVTQIIIGIIFVLVGIYVAFIRPWLRSKLTPEQLNLLRQFS